MLLHTVNEAKHLPDILASTGAEGPVTKLMQHVGCLGLGHAALRSGKVRWKSNDAGSGCKD